MIRNPKWEYDEIILAIELYLKFRKNPPGPNDCAVKNLSVILRIYQNLKNKSVNPTLRNVNGVAMKLQNLRSIDLKSKVIGLKNAAFVESEMWKNFSSQPKKIKFLANKIRKKIESKYIYANK